MISVEDRIVNGPDFQEPVPDVSLGKFILGHLLRNKNTEAFIDAKTDAKITFSQFLQNTIELAQCLEKCGYGSNDVLSIYSENNMYYMQTVVAAALQGVTVATMNPNFFGDELLHTLNISKPQILFCSQASVKRILDLKSKLNFLEHIVIFNLDDDLERKQQSYIEKKQSNESIQKVNIPNINKQNITSIHKQNLASIYKQNIPNTKKQNISSIYKPNAPHIHTIKSFLSQYSDDYINVKDFQVAQHNPDDHVAAIICSSGTTGLPKGVMISDKNIIAKIMQKKDKRFFPDKEVTQFGYLPFFHVFGFMTCLDNISLGYCTVVMDRYKEETFLNNLQKYKITHVCVVPPVMVFLAKSPLVDQYDLSSVKELICGAAPIGKEIEVTVKQRLNIQRVLQAYGLTELTYMATLTPGTGGKFGSSGRLLQGMQAKVIDPDSGSSLGANKVGELCFRGSTVSKGYYGNMEATKAAIDEEGWLHSGDLGFYDEDEFFYIVDRIKELIKYNGFQVAPAEIEAILLTNPKIKDAAVVGLPDEITGEKALAFIVKQSGVEISEKDVQNYVASKASTLKHLHGGVIFVQEIPKNPSGKILRRKLREMLKVQSSKL